MRVRCWSWQGCSARETTRRILAALPVMGTPAWLYRRVWLRGGGHGCLAAQNLAMSRFNIGDLHGYRLWLRRAQILGDNDAGLELDRFETRQPFGAARAIGRGRPLRRSERWPVANA